MIKTGIIGYGYWGKILETKLRPISDIQFIQTSKNYNTTKFKSADWIFIASPPKTHYKIAKDCIKAGVNVFIEKPPADSADGLRDLINIAEPLGVKIFVDNVFLYREEISVIKNDYNCVRFVWHKKDSFGYGAFDDFLYHDLYILLSVFGEMEMSGIKVYTIDKDFVYIEFSYGNILVSIDYSQKQDIKTKTIQFDDMVINFPETKQDALLTMIKRLFDGNINFPAHYRLNLASMILMDKIKSSQ